MKIGQDEIGTIGILMLPFFMIGGFLLFNGLMYGYYQSIVGLIVWLVAFPIYYMDLLEHRKQRQYRESKSES